MLVLNLPRKLTDSAVPAVERHLARRPEAWIWVAGRGKLRRYAGDRQGLDDLQGAGDTYLRVFADRNPNLLIPINLYRLAGSRQAGPLLDQLRARLIGAAEQDGHHAMRTGSLVEVCFFQGDDEQVQAVFAALQAVDRIGLNGTRYPSVARLAAGRATGDVAACDEAVAWFDSLVARERDSVSGAGEANAYDWLEIALVTRSEVAGELSPRLFEL